MEDDLPLCLETKNFVETQLLPGEELCWTGRPLGRFFAMPTPFVFLFSCIWFSVISFFTYSSLQEGNSFSILFTIPFWCVGIGVLSTPFFMLRKKQRTVYAITTQRVLIADRGAFGKMTCRQYPLEQGLIMRTQYGNNGVGDIIFAEEIVQSGRGSGSMPIGFMELPDAAQMEQMLHRFIAEREGRGEA